MPQRTSKKSKTKDSRPARSRYWARRVLEFRKVAQLMRWGYSQAEALKYWRRQRQGRVPLGWLKKECSPDESA